VLCRRGDPPRLLPGGTEPELRSGERLVAVDLEDRADPDALRLGSDAGRRLAWHLLGLGAAKLRAHPSGDDLARLVPEYVTLPRGVRAAVDDGVAVTAEAG
jgi:hypothetical protein